MISKIANMFDRKKISDSDNESTVKVPFTLEMAKRKYEEEIRSKYHIEKRKSMKYTELNDDLKENSL